MFFLKDLPTRQMIDGYAARYPGVESEMVGEALAMMRRASLLIRELERYFAEHELSQIRFLILMVIDREIDGDGLSPLEIATRIDVSKPVTTRTLKVLEESGLIGISDNVDDGRSKRVRLTRSGRAKLKQVLPGYFQMIMAFMHEDGD